MVCSGFDDIGDESFDPSEFDFGAAEVEESVDGCDGEGKVSALQTEQEGVLPHLPALLLVLQTFLRSIECLLTGPSVRGDAVNPKWNLTSCRIAEVRYSD